MLGVDSTSIRRKGDRTWLGLWRRADDAAALALTRGLRVEASVGDRPNEPAVARATLDAARRHQASALVVSSSMPIRDLEWFSTAAPVSITAAGRHPDPVVLANRGANGIDGVLATAAGVALATGALGAIRGGEAEASAVWLLIGDLALLHDSNALLSLTRRPLRLRLVVVDNGGGGIFSFLPQARLVDPDRFEQLFGTAQAIDLVALLNVHGLDTAQVFSLDRLEAALDELAGSRASVAALVVRCLDRAANVAVHARLEALVARALESLSAAAPDPSAGDDALKALG